MSRPMAVTIYHNPRCSKSRATLALLQDSGVEPVVVEYLKDPPSAAELKRILAMLRMRPRELMRRKESQEAGLDDPGLSDEALIEAMVSNPVVIERPIAVHGDRARLGRPPEAVLEIL